MLALLGRVESKSEAEFLDLHVKAAYSQPKQYNFTQLSTCDLQPLHSRSLPVSARAAYVAKRRASRISPQKPCAPASTSPTEKEEMFSNVDLNHHHQDHIMFPPTPKDEMNIDEETSAGAGTGIFSCFDFGFRRRGSKSRTNNSADREITSSEDCDTSISQRNTSTSFFQRARILFDLGLPCFSCRFAVADDEDLSCTQ